MCQASGTAPELMSLVMIQPLWLCRLIRRQEVVTIAGDGRETHIGI